MGDEAATTTTAAARAAAAARVRRQRSIYQVHYALPRRAEHMARPWPPAPAQVTPYSAQVAGHSGEQNHHYLGLLQCDNGTILKPILKEAQGREVGFYARVASARDPDLVALRQLTPRYFGTRRHAHLGHELLYIELEDLAERMLEPCIMDVKIGKRTWDPLASEAKISAEQSKYGACRQQFGFCIPGFQVYRLSTGQLARYGKDYGKKLHGDMVKEAIKTYLNSAGSGSPCRALLLQFLSALWRIQRWAARPRRLRLYAASLLLAYDARRLRDCCAQEDFLTGTGKGTAPCKKTRPRCIPLSNGRRRSIHCITGEPATASFSGQLGDKGPLFRKVNSVPLTSLALATQSFQLPSPPTSSAWGDALHTVGRLHSFDHNYEDKLCKIKMNYRATLDQLANDDDTHSLWGTVKIIDFAHAFFNDAGEESDAIDENFRDGIDSFVAIFEELLKETDDQVF